MGVTSGWAVHEARRQIVGHASDGLGWRDFAAALLEIYTALIPVDAIVISSIDPHSGLMTNLTRTGIDDAHDDLFIHIELTQPDPITLTTLARTHDGVGILADHLTGDPRRNARVRDLLPHYDLAHEMRGVVRVRGQMWATVALYRGPGRRGFTADEAATLAALEEAVSFGVHSTLLCPTDNPGSFTTAGPPVLLVDESGRVVQATAAGTARLTDLGWDGRGHLPTPIYWPMTAARQAAAGHAVPAFAHTRLPSGAWVVVRAAALPTPEAGPRIVVSIEPASGEVVPDAAGHPATGRVLILTDRQHDVLALVARGHTNARIAFELGIAEGTVRKHMETILQTLGAGNRAEAAALWTSTARTRRG